MNSMKILISIITVFLMSCKPVVKPNYPDDDTGGKYSREISPDKQFALFYKFEKKSSNPVRWLTYYVTETRGNILKKEKSSIPADSIYWRSDNVLVIIPYREVIKEQNVVGEDNNDNQILIPVK